MSSSSIRDQRAERIRLEEDVLDRHTKLLDDIRRAERQTEEDLATTQAKLDSLRTERETEERRHSSMSRTFHDVRDQHRREIWTNVIPLDVLRCIFDELAALPDHEWPEFGSGVVNRTRSARPFSVATVCSRWRRLAISMSSLWTYIAIAIDTVRTEVPADRILEQLRRSKNLPLDILLRLEDAPPSAHDGIVEVVTLLHGECHRLRRYEFWLPAGGDIGRDPLMDPFQSPTPLLVSFSLLLPVNYDEIEWPEDARDTYFPHTPKLQHIELSRSSISCSPLFATFTNMVSLALWYSSFENFATMARMSAPTLQYLSLFEEWGDVPPTPPPIVFPALHTLLLRTANPVLRDLIVAPKLRHITLDGNALEIELCPFLELVSSTVSHLTLSGNGLVDEVALVVRALDKVQHLTFSRSVAVDSYNVSDSLFEELASLTPTVWPKLQSIHFTEDAHDDSEELGAGLLRLVRARAPVPTASGSAATDPAQRTLTRVDIDTHAVPKWLRSTIDHILSSNNVAAVG